MDKTKKKFPSLCPACDSRLKVQKFHCVSCGTDVEGVFELPQIARLSQQEQDFIINFVITSGNLKEMARIMDKSYPSVRNYLDELIEKVKTL